MTRKQFGVLIEIAQQGPVAETAEEIWKLMEPFDGCALHKNRFYATTKQVIQFIRYQCMYLNGEWNHQELESCANIAKRIDLLESKRLIEAA